MIAEQASEVAEEIVREILEQKLDPTTTAFTLTVGVEGVQVDLVLIGLGKGRFMLEATLFTISREAVEYFISAQFWDVIEKLSAKYLKG